MMRIYFGFPLGPMKVRFRFRCSFMCAHASDGNELQILRLDLAPFPQFACRYYHSSNSNHQSKEVQQQLAHRIRKLYKNDVVRL